MRGPAPNGIETRLAELAFGVDESAAALNQRSGSNAAARGKWRSLTLSRRITLVTMMPAGMRTSPIVTSRKVSSGRIGATGFALEPSRHSGLPPERRTTLHPLVARSERTPLPGHQQTPYRGITQCW